MQNIRSKVHYPCTGCLRDGKAGCMDKHCARWWEWFSGGAWKTVIEEVKDAARN